MSVASRTPRTYIITDTDQIIGLLGQGNCLTYGNGNTRYEEQISEELKISTLQIQKVMAIIEKTQSKNLTAKELAYYFDVTVRSANRILNRLEEKGIARVLYKKQEKLRGRPKKIYQIVFPSESKDVLDVDISTDR